MTWLLRLLASFKKNSVSSFVSQTLVVYLLGDLMNNHFIKIYYEIKRQKD